MKATKKMASTAKKSAKIIGMAAMAAAMFHQAEADMKKEFGKDYIPMDKNVYCVNYTYNPFDGMLA